MNQAPMGTFAYTVMAGDTLWTIAQRFAVPLESVMQANPGINPGSLMIGQVIYIPLGTQYPGYEDDHYQYLNEAELELNNKIRMLWEQHIAWTRMVIMDLIYDLPETQFAVQRLLRNPSDFADLFRQYYGNDFAEQFKRLLSNHLTIAAELVQAAKANDSAKAADAERRWYQNADDIAQALASVNPYWDREDWRSMLYNHLALVKEEAVNFLTKEYEKNVLLFDEMERQAMEMSDSMVEGLLQQFPDRFE